MKISRRYYSIVFAVLVTLTMSFFMSFVLTLVNAGFGPQFLRIWFSAFAIGFLVGLPISFVFVPLIRRFVDKLTCDKQE